MNLKDLWEKLFQTTLAIYFIAAFIFFTPYYNWKYAQTHGFVKWIFFGEIIATTKAMVWPYYVVKDNFNEMLTKNENIPKRDTLDQVVVFTTLQDAEGATEEDFNVEELNKLELWSKLLAIEKGSKIYATGNVPAKLTDIPDVDAMYVTVGGKKLAVIKMTLYPPNDSGKSIFKMVRIIGFTDKGLESVLCGREGNQDVPVWSGACGGKIQEIFGVIK